MDKSAKIIIAFFLCAAFLLMTMGPLAALAWGAEDDLPIEVSGSNENELPGMVPDFSFDFEDLLPDEPLPSKFSELLDSISQIFSAALGWVPDVAAAVTGNPYLLLFGLLSLVGLGVGLFSRARNSS